MRYWQHRRAEVVAALLRYPMTSEMLQRASKSFLRPFTSPTQTKALLTELHRQGFINRQAIPLPGPGQKPFLYFLKRKAARLAPEIGDLPVSNAVFRGFTESPWHTLAVCEFLSHFERSVGELGPRVKLLAALRPRAFTAKVEVPTSTGREKADLIPDYTLAVELDGVPNLFFVELQHRAAVICPVSPQSVTRSFQFKLAKYKAFLASMRTHPMIQHLERVLGCTLPGFRVLVVTTKGPLNKRHLVDAARDYRKLFYFATIEEAAKVNVLTAPIWALPNGLQRPIFDSPSAELFA